jgi:glutamyl-tRNA synthetase
VPENKPRLEKLRDAFAMLEKFDAAAIETALKATAAALGIKVGMLVHPVRLACTGNPNGPSLYHLLEIIGKEKALGRIEKGLANFDA